MVADDLRTHTSTLDTPISVDYKGLRLWECPPNGQGVVALLTLNILEPYDLKCEQKFCYVSQVYALNMR